MSCQEDTRNRHPQEFAKTLHQIAPVDAARVAKKPAIASIRHIRGTSTSPTGEGRDETRYARPRASLAPAPPFLPPALALRPQARRLNFERLAAVELDHVAPGQGFGRTHFMEVDGDATLAVHVRPARAVDLHPLVHERGDLRVRGRGGEGVRSRTSVEW